MKKPKPRPAVLGSPRAPKKSPIPPSREEALAVMGSNREMKRDADADGMAAGGVVRGGKAQIKGKRFTRDG